VVKNVTGYDLCKLLAGSCGTLAAMTDVTIKTLPRPESEETILVLGLKPADAVVAMTAAMGSSCDVSGAAHLPADVAALVPDIAGAGTAVTALRLEGFAPSVAHRAGTLTALLKPFGEVARTGPDACRKLWRAVRDVAPLADSSGQHGRTVWRISTVPSRGAELVARVAAAGDVQVMFDWAGGLVWLSLPHSDDGGAALVRRAVGASGGHATLIRAPAAVRAAVAVFEPAGAGLAALSRRVKEGFDPKGVLNPGRMWAGV
jgi:glycolate oxidase FAD binding subunit